MIEFENVSRNYGSVVAVKDVSVEIARGEIVGLLGHNGAGKTTLMQMLTGYLEPTSGSIRVGGRDVVEQRIEAQRQIGYLPESAPLYREMLVQEYLLMMANLRGVAPEKQRDAVAEAAGATGLHQHMIKPISTLSKGYRQRVGLAQAILHSPDVLVLDEPTNGLDPVQIQSIRDLITDLGKNTTIILSTHILQEVEAVCDRVLIMINGVLVENATLTQLIASNTVQLSVKAGAEGVQSKLSAIKGVCEVQPLGSDERIPGHQAWAIDCESETPLTPTILSTALEAGWTIGSIGPRVRTLDGVFKQLQRDHVARQRGAQ
jgi:ABC-2 type transport system ATP-binding protein